MILTPMFPTLMSGQMMIFALPATGLSRLTFFAATAVETAEELAAFLTKWKEARA